MPAIRIGAVGYLNSRPLVHGLAGDGEAFDVRFDVPSRCATLLHEGAIDIGLVPSIEYLRGGPYVIVPDIAVASEDAVASVAIFSKVPPERIARLALDTSSRTSAALAQVLCRERFGIAPSVAPASPNLSTMLADADAALLIGDPALFTDHVSLGLLKIDLGAEWRALTGLPFVWAFWAGRPAVMSEAVTGALARARDRGVAAIAAIAEEASGGEPTVRKQIAGYLRENISYHLGDAHQRALERFYESAVRLGLASSPGALRFAPRATSIASP